VLSEAGIDDEDPPTVEFVVRKGDPPVDLNLAVRWRDKAFLVPPVKSTITVAELKETAAAKLGTHISPYSASDLRFYHFGRTLYEAARLCDVGIANQATLNLLLEAIPTFPSGNLRRLPSFLPTPFCPAFLSENVSAQVLTQVLYVWLRRRCLRIRVVRCCAGAFPNRTLAEQSSVALACANI